MPFTDPLVGGLFLIRNSIRSPNYVPGLSGWAINRDGSAEFAAGTFRGTIVVVAANGQMITIDPSSNNPQITFFSQDGSNFAFINAPNGGVATRAGLGMNSGIFTPADAVARRGRVFLDDFTGVNQFAVVRSSDGSRFGGYVHLRYDAGFFGYANDTGAVLQNLVCGAAGFSMTADSWQFGGANVSMDTPTPGGLKKFEQGRGIISEMYYTGGTGATSAGVTEAALVAWTGADSTRFINGRLYEIDIRGGVFSSVAAGTELADIKVRSAVNSTVAQQLGELRMPCVGGGSVTTFHDTFYVKNTSGADIDKTSLGVTVARAAGTGNHSIFGNVANFALQVTVRDVGFPGDTQLTNVATAIT